MQRRKPTIEYDFGRGHMAERLPRQAVLKLEERNLPTNKLQQELRAYLRAKPVREVIPRQLLQIITRYVNVQPTDFREMEMVVGSPSARRMLPNAEEIPTLAWATQDYLDYLDREFGDRYRRDLDQLINAMIGERREYQRLALQWLNRAVSTPQEAMSYYWRHQKKSSQTSRRPTAV